MLVDSIWQGLRGVGAMTRHTDYSDELIGVIMQSLNASEDGFAVFDQSDRLMYSNRIFSGLFNLQVEEAIGKSFEYMLRNSYASGCGIMADNDDVEGMVQRALSRRQEKGFISFENERANGEWMKVSRFRTQEGYIVTYSSNISQLKGTEKQLRKALKRQQELASTDFLTGISNRRFFMMSGCAELKRCQRYQHSLSVLTLDIDHFKEVNDLFGHDAGDQVIKTISVCCKKLLRESDILGRLGGDEFAILLPETNRHEAEQTAVRILKAVANLTVNYGEQSIKFTASLGVSLLSTQNQSLDELMIQSDRALYLAKDKGRNRYEVHEPD